MSNTMRSTALISPDNALPSPAQRMAKADLRSSAAASDLSTLIKDAAKRVHGKQATAAAVVGKAESNFSRDVDSGAFRTGDLAQLGPRFLAELGKELVEQYGALDTPATRARQQLRIARAALDELDDYVEHIA